MSKFANSSPKDQEVEEVWANFWEDILVDQNGNLDVEQLKKELRDYQTLMWNVSEVYCEITGNQISKPLTNPRVVLDYADEYYKRLYQNMDVDELKEIMGID